jgi:guanosine-3',5'-bis(diphosphate) 3'-pyrophosphohydrolase
MGAKVNVTFVSLRQTLNTGDVVEILASKSQKPSRNWLNIARTSKALQKIRRYLQETEKIPARILRAKPIEENAKKETGILVCDSVKNPSFKIANCCLPIPGDKVVGLVSKVSTVTIHKKDCPLIENASKKKIKVDWQQNFSDIIILKIEALDRVGLFADVLNTISATGTNIQSANAKVLGNNMAEASFKVKIEDLEHVKDLIARIKKVQDVKKIYIGDVGL